MSNATQPLFFNPYTQNFSLLMADGVTVFSVGIPDLDEFVLYNTQVGINYASQIGASVIMLVLVLLITRESKRRSPIFFINVISLILSIVRSLLQTLYWVGPFSESFAYFSGDYSAVPASAYANSVASIVMTLLLLCSVELSLVLQTRVVCITLRETYRVAIVALSLFITLFTVGFRFGDMVENAIAIVNLEPTYSWLASAALIMETISIWFFCLIFVGKLGVTLYQRKKLGLRQWGPMQIICIMGGCTMVIPSIFAILEYFPDTTFPEAGSLALTLVAIFLPLSSIWAAAAIDGTSPIAHAQSNNYSGSCSSNGYSGRSRDGSTFDRKGSLGPLTPSTVMTVAEHVPADDGSLMMRGKMIGDYEGDFKRMGVRIERTYSVQSGSKTGARKE